LQPGFATPEGAVSVPAISRTQLIELLSAGEFDEILGTEENPQIDFKSHAYNVHTPKDRADLVADIASFGNHIGGTIVLGVEAQKDETTKRECATRICGVARSAVDEDAYRKLVDAHVHPHVAGLEIRWYGRASGGPEVVGLHIDPQGDNDKPLFVDRIANPETPDRALPNAVGWPVRSGSETYWTPAARIQQLVSIGHRLGMSVETSSPTEAEDDAREQLAYIAEQTEEWGELPTYAVQVIPLGHAPKIDDFYGDFAPRLNTWRGIRPYGFGLGLQFSRMTARGQWWTVIDDAPSFIVSRTGALTGACTVSQRFLGWAMPSTGERVGLNPTALVEFTTEVLRLGYECVKPMLNDWSKWRIRAQGERWVEGERRVCLITRTLPYAVRMPSTPSFDFGLDGTGDSYADAASLLADIFGGVFAMPRTSFPYVTGDRVDLHLIPNA
jgi:hypothetical protein